jgi:hypothetical protein
MSSSSTRAQLVTRALSLAGRGVELQSEANDWLNDMLRDWALDFKFPSLRKVGVSLTLSAGNSTLDLPSDFGAGMEKQGLLLGDEATPLGEKDFQEFTTLGGFPSSSAGSGRPVFYMVDKNAKKFIFNCVADRAYAVKATYYACPDRIPNTAAGDLQSVWPDNDNIVVQGLIERIYQFTNDAREAGQANKVYHPQSGMFTVWKRQLATMGGTSRVQLSPERFKRVRF